MVRYTNFEDWFDERELFDSRADRFFDSMSQFNSEEGKYANIRLWLQAAFQAGRETLKPCRSPYCECTVGKCTHPGCYDARGD